MVKKKEVNPDDLALFHAAMKGTKRLSLKKKRITKPPPAIKPRIKENPPPDIFDDRIDEDIAPVRGEEFIAFKQASISNKILRKLRKGQYNVEGILDLHGMTTDEARNAVEDFLQQCLIKKVRVVLIIHGKGTHSQGPILKNKLNQWLRSSKSILAFCSAAPTHGSRGALYVLLRGQVDKDYGS